MTWPLGVSTGSLYPHQPTEAAVATIAALGFATCECYFQAHSENFPPFHRTLTTALRAAALAVHSVHTVTTYLDFWSPYARRRQDAYDLFYAAIDGTATIGARCINWHGPSLQEQQRGATPAQTAELVAHLAERAQGAGVLLTLENVSWCTIRTVDDIRWWQAQNLPIGFCYDPFQAAESLADPALQGNADPIALLQTMGPDLATVHLSDYHPTGPRHLPPGQGVLPWPAIIAALHTLPYTGPLIIEPAHLPAHDTTPLQESAAFLRGLIHPSGESSQKSGVVVG